ncbi:MAG: Mu-like prophage major head subunit gpT family protein [Myxococcales bacterium]|nr:Mu-like prophage major head subunit gpT family protein [Myxococcales bacterium]
MLVNAGAISTVFRGFNAAFNKGFEGAKSHHKRVATIVPSSAREENYGWLAQLPKMREWVGDRVIHSLALHGYAITNKLFESTIAVKRIDIEDDRYGVFSPIVQEMGRESAEHPDTLIFALLGLGFATECYDGQYFFDTDHPVMDATDQVVSASNMQAGAGPAWYLLDTRRVIKPLIFQERAAYKPTVLNNEGDYNVFMRDEYLYGVRARVNAGFGLWQLAFGSKDDLIADNYEAAREAMMSLRGDQGRPLGIIPDTLVVPPELEGDARRLINNGTRIVTVGADSVPVANEWAGTAEVIVSAFLAS